MKYSWMSPITFSANSVEKMQVFWPWSSLRMSACTVPRTVASVHARIFAASSSVGSRPLSARNLSSCWSIAVFRNIARIVGAGPLIVIDTEVVGRAEVEARVEHLHVVERGDRHAGVADLAVDVGAPVGVVAVERDRVERGRQPLGRHAVGEQVEAPVGAERVALAGEHARRVLVLALEREHAGGEREAARAGSPAAASAGARRRRRSAAARPCGSCVPDSDVVVSAVRISLSRIFTTYSSPA